MPCLADDAEGQNLQLNARMIIHLVFRKVEKILQVKKSCNLLCLFSEHHNLLATLSLDSRSNSSISLTSSAKSSTSSNDSSRVYRSSISSVTPPRFRSKSKSPTLPKILPSLPECVIAYDNLILGPLEQFLQFSSKGHFQTVFCMYLKMLYRLQTLLVKMSEDKHKWSKICLKSNVNSS